MLFRSGTLAKTGAFQECINDFGLYDMVGNLNEWTSDPNGTFQGGYWLDTSLHGDGCAYRTIAHPFDYRDYSIGFRCCADPEETRATSRLRHNGRRSWTGYTRPATSRSSKP